MMKKQFVLGIDLGTSAVKGILRSADGETFKTKYAYRSESLSDWLDAMASLIADLRAVSGG
jgi:sugar (pentulose or hexulose) kinase